MDGQGVIRSIMKNLFVINPCAGEKNHVSDIESKVKALDGSAEVYVTRNPGDATRIVESFCGLNVGDGIRIYACGGDGTLNEVVTGIMNWKQNGGNGEGVEVGCYPCGSGNDYVKYWTGGDFNNLEKLMTAQSVEVDVMKVSYEAGMVGRADGHDLRRVRYALNTLNYGFEAEVCRVMAEVRRKPLIGGRMAYTTGIVKSLVKGRHNPCRIFVDGELWREGDCMLASLANGRYEGGGFRSAPRSMNDDGLLEVTAISPISIARFASIIGQYKSGKYLDNASLHDIVAYCRAQHVGIESHTDFCVGIDGELLMGNHFDIENMRRELKFIVVDSVNETGK